MAGASVFVAGHGGMVGSAITRELSQRGGCRLVLRSSAELDLTDQSAVCQFFDAERPDLVYLAAAKVGGIHANDTYPADFIYRNLMIQANVIEAAFRAGVDRLMFLGSSCIYPRLASQPMTEDLLLSGELEPTNEPYAVAKIAGIKLCESYNRQHGTDYRCVMPTNLYGPGDNYHPRDSHVIPALIRRFHEAKLEGRRSVSVWGTGTVRREFLYVDDLARACVDLMAIDRDTFWSGRDPRCSHVNIGTGLDVTIKELADKVASVVGYSGRVTFDPGMPDGAPRKLLDVGGATRLGWSPSVGLDDGLALAYEAFLGGDQVRGGST